MKHLKKLLREEEGFTLVELIVVIVVMAILFQVGLFSFNRFTRRTRAFAAKNALINIKSECVANRDLGNDETFTPLTLNGYSIQTSNINSCLGEAGSRLVFAIPDLPNQYPIYSYDHSEGKIECSYNNAFDNLFKACLSLKSRLETNDLVIKDSYIERDCSAYVVVKGGTWKEAEANANKIGGHLATINDKDENKWIANEFGKEKYFYEGDSNPGDPESWSHFWIGANDKDSEGNMTWSSGEEFTFNDELKPKDLRENNLYSERDYVAIIFNVPRKGNYDWNIGHNNHDPNMNNNFRGLVEIPKCKK